MHSTMTKNLPINMLEARFSRIAPCTNHSIDGATNMKNQQDTHGVADD